MSARSRGSSVGKLVQRFETNTHEAKIRSEPKGHPLAFAFARWWRAVQPLEKFGQTAPTQNFVKPEVKSRFERAKQMDGGPILPPDHKVTKEEGEHLSCSTQTPSQGQSGCSEGSEALVMAARDFLAKHRSSDPSLDLSARRIRLDVDSDSESEERGARDVLAAAKLLARIQHLSSSLPDAFCSSLGELWTSPPLQIQKSSWKESYDSMILSESEKEDWQLTAEGQLQSAQEVIKEQRDLLHLEQLQREEMQKKIHDLEEQNDLLQLERERCEELERELRQKQEQVDALQLEEVQSKELREKVHTREEQNDLLQLERERCEELERELKQKQEQLKMMQLEKLQWDELEAKMKKTQERYEMLHGELERNLQEQRDLLQLEKLQCEELEKKNKKTQELVHKEQKKVELLEAQVNVLLKENVELHNCRDQLAEVLEERQVLLDALAVNDALAPKDEMREVLREASDSAAENGAAALRSAAAVLHELRRRLATSEAKRQQLQQLCEKLEVRNDQDAKELQGYQELYRQQMLEENHQNDTGVSCAPDVQDSINLPHEVMSAADLAAHLRGGGGQPLRAQASQEVAHCQELAKRLNALQKERDAMAVEVREALTLCGRAAHAARNAREARLDRH